MGAINEQDLKSSIAKVLNLEKERLRMCLSSIYKMMNCNRRSDIETNIATQLLQCYS